MAQETASQIALGRFGSPCLLSRSHVNFLPMKFKDKRRKHQHWQVTVYYGEGEKFARVYIDRDRAEKFAARAKKSPVVESVRVTEVDW
jgi:hypothetical protein